ncbi:MAG: IMP dehydrogenase [Gammaproteobacteria bacterium CG11_big_fil_rev_8_21_14_0_20_46_22]|nr:MAG: IMP dehydrogenase [Gammaproteobacteria bacterium CG12_big_fil_rev_8_21_14_0_65_46_12]PIR10452.1 MAG: IMP dehydrogenase [Gammaproteobacteria bacterium CG11_big_fil_rev_8_21_14_0_20_46_22]
MRLSTDALTFDDVLLLPRESHVLPKDAKLGTQLTRGLRLNIPLLSAAMDTVSEARLAVALAQEGGLSVIHKNMSLEAQADEVRRVKRFENGVINDPITVGPDCRVGDLMALTQKNNFSGVPVVDGDNDLIGIVTSRDMRFETNFEQPVKNIMTRKEQLVTVREGASSEEVIALMHEHRIEKILVVNEAFKLRGMYTVTDILKAKEKPQAAKDNRGRLLVGAAVGVSDKEKARVEALIAADVDVIVIDTAHGHSAGVIDQVAWVKKHFPNVQLIGGNIATADAAKALLKAGVDAVKVGIGPGSICTTRIVTGVGVPQITAISSVAKALKGSGVPLIADGGIRFSGDICKAIAAGANTVMVGSLFAGTDEAPGETILYQGRSYKTYRGMGSLGAMTQGSSDRYFQSNVAEDKLVPEGIEGRVPYKGSMLGVVSQLMGGLRSCMGYLGCESIPVLQNNAEFVRISAAGMRESHVHDITITKQAPNYWVE